MVKYYDLYINNQWSAQYTRKADALSDAKEVFQDEGVTTVEVVKCENYDPRDGGETVYTKTKIH